MFNRIKKFFTERFPGKFAVKWISKMPPHLAYVATLPCETLMSAKQAINDKLQGSVAAYLRCGGVVNNQIKKGLLLSLQVKVVLQLVNIWHSYKQERDCFMHFFRLLAVCWPNAQVHETITFLLVTLSNIHQLKFFSLSDSAITHTRLTALFPGLPG